MVKQLFTLDELSYYELNCINKFKYDITPTWIKPGCTIIIIMLFYIDIFICIIKIGIINYHKWYFIFFNSTFSVESSHEY